MPTCFVIMPFGKTTEKHTAEYWTDHFEHFIKPAVEDASDGQRLLGYTVQCSDPVGGGIIQHILKNIEEADVVLAEMTDFNPNVLYELGIRHCLRERTIVIIEKGQTGELAVPFDFQTYKVIGYSKKSDKDRDLFRQEIKRRLIELMRQPSNPWDNPVSDYFHGTDRRITIVPRYGPETIASVIRESGFLNIYVPKTNDERIIPKRDTILGAQKTIKLMADTGHSYLSKSRRLYRHHLAKKLEDNVKVQILILSPWCDDSAFIAIKELPESTLSTAEKDRILHKVDKGDLKGFDVIRLIESTPFYKDKFVESIEGYIDLAEKYGERIELRLTKFIIPATALASENKCFFEPYLKADLSKRLKELMVSFEVEVTNSCYFYNQVVDHFGFFWEVSETYKEFKRREEKYKEELSGKYE